MGNQFDFNTVLKDIAGKPIVQPRPTQEQQQALRQAAAAEDFEEVQRIERAIKDVQVTLGEVCVNALMGKAKADEHDGQQLMTRTNLAQKIRGTFDDEADADEDAGAYGVVTVSDKRVKMLLDLIKETYKGGALIYTRATNILNNRDQMDCGIAEDD